jgi:hypothetical protein
MPAEFDDLIINLVCRHALYANVVRKSIISYLQLIKGQNDV